MAIIGGIIALLGLFAVIAAQARHRDETGVGAPTKAARARIRKRAKRNGQTETEAYQDWLSHKQKRAGGRTVPLLVRPEPAAIDGLAITFPGIQDGEARFAFHCKACGGYILHVADDPHRPTSEVICKACSAPLGTLAEVQKRARQVASSYGVKVGAGHVWRDEMNKPI